MQDLSINSKHFSSLKILYIFSKVLPVVIKVNLMSFFLMSSSFFFVIPLIINLNESSESEKIKVPFVYFLNSMASSFILS